MDIDSIPGVGEKTAAALAKLDDPVAAIRDGDVATLARAPGISPKRAAKIARSGLRYEHGDSGGFVATPQAREIAETTLEILAERTVTDYAAQRLRALYPSSSRSRIEEVRTFTQRAMDRDPDPAVRKALSAVRPPDSPEAVRVRDRCLATSDAETYARAQEAVPELSVEHVDDARQLADLGRGYTTVIVLDEEFAGIDVDGDVRIEPNALEKPESVVPERTLSWFGTNRDRIRAAIEVHRQSDLDPPCELDDLEDRLTDIEPDGSVRGDAELERRRTAVADLDAAVSNAESVANDHIREAIEKRDITIEGTDLLSLVERGAGAETVLTRELSEEYEHAVEAARTHLIDTLSLDGNAALAKQAFDDDPSFPVEHDEMVVGRLREELTAGRDRYASTRKREFAAELATFKEPARTLLDAALELDVELAVAKFTHDFDCVLPEISSTGRELIVEGGRLPLLDVPFDEVEPIDYRVDEVTLLTGVNSGGKTATLDLLALVVTLAHMGLPVPADHASVPRLDELHYYGKSQGTLDAGAFEATVREFGELVTDIEDDAVLVLVDELESITEPGAAATIVAGILEALDERDALAVFVSHLATDIRAAANRPIPVDGIQARGLDDGELVVDRTPVSGVLARSTPELIVEKLADHSNPADEREFYATLLEKFE